MRLEVSCGLPGFGGRERDDLGYHPTAQLWAGLRGRECVMSAQVGRWLPLGSVQVPLFAGKSHLFVEASGPLGGSMESV